MKAWFKNFVFLAAFLPLAYKMPYLRTVWASSPVERWDKFLWLSLLLLIPLCEWIRRRANIRSRHFPREKLWTALALCGVLPMLAFAYVKQINAAVILLGISLIAVAVQWRFGRRVFVGQIPCFFIAVIASPSLSYWLNYYLNAGLEGTRGYFYAKLALGLAFFAGWSIYALYQKRYPRLLSVLFAALLLASVFVNKVNAHRLPSGAPSYLDPAKYEGENRWLGKELSLSAVDRRFFSGCERVSRRVYYNDYDQVGVLGIVVGADIHAVHPVGICLESAGWDVSSQRQAYFPSAHGEIQGAQIQASKDGKEYLIWTWFSSDKLSTGDFALFRFLRKRGEGWRHYQIMTPVTKGDLAHARDVLSSFILTFEQARVSSASKLDLPAATR